MKKERVIRRRRIPAFGEWNYDDGGGCYGYGYGYRDGDWPVTQYFDSAMQMHAAGEGGLVISLPPSPKPPNKAVKWIDSGALGEEEEKQRQRQRQHKVVVGLAEHGAARATKLQGGKQSRVANADAGAHASVRGVGYKAVVVKGAVDRDLYEIPPDMLCHKPRKRLTRSLWIGCLGLSCVA